VYPFFCCVNFAVARMWGRFTAFSMNREAPQSSKLTEQHKKRQFLTNLSLWEKLMKNWFIIEIWKNKIHIISTQKNLFYIVTTKKLSGIKILETRERIPIIFYTKRYFDGQKSNPLNFVEHETVYAPKFGKNMISPSPTSSSVVQHFEITSSESHVQPKILYLNEPFFLCSCL